MSFKMYQTQAFAKKTPEGPFEKIDIKRNVCGDGDIEFDVKFCGICHTDVHFAQDEVNFLKVNFPCVPGHELAGLVTKVSTYNNIL